VIPVVEAAGIRPPASAKRHPEVRRCATEIASLDAPWCGVQAEMAIAVKLRLTVTVRGLAAVAVVIASLLGVLRPHGSAPQILHSPNPASAVVAGTVPDSLTIRYICFTLGAHLAAGDQRGGQCGR
jgi:hypothetical protein